MSIISTLALMASAVIARSRPSADVEITRLQAKVDDLNRQFDDHLATVTRQRDEWQALAMSYRNALYGQRDTSLQQHFINQEMRQRQFSQAAQQMQQNAQLQYLNAQSNQSEPWCNCVPARHDMFMPR